MDLYVIVLLYNLILAKIVFFFLPVFQDAKFENFIKQNWQNEQVTIENEVANVSLVGYHLDDEAIL
jgi:hypothetical protein